MRCMLHIDRFPQHIIFQLILLLLLLLYILSVLIYMSYCIIFAMSLCIVLLDIYLEMIKRPIIWNRVSDVLLEQEKNITTTLFLKIKQKKQSRLVMVCVAGSERSGSRCALHFRACSLDMNSFRVGNDINNKKYNKRPEFILDKKKQTYNNYIKRLGINPNLEVWN